MSISRASGAIATITALQIATASLAAPKSDIKTMVARDRWLAGDPAPSRGDCGAQPTQARPSKTGKKTVSDGVHLLNGVLRWKVSYRAFAGPQDPVGERINCSWAGMCC